jgi:hypothetical protein
LLAGVSASDAFFAAVRSEAPSRAAEALYRVAVGPTEYDESFTGFDAVFLLNLTGQALTDPTLGIADGVVDPKFFEPLMAGGYGTNPLFGGLGPMALTSLPAYGVYETLIPIGDDADMFFNFGASGIVPVTGLQLADGQVGFAVSTPEPSTVVLLLAGFVCLTGAKRWRRANPELRNCGAA